MKQLTIEEKSTIQTVLTTAKECLKVFNLEIHHDKFHGICLVDGETKKFVSLIDDEKIDKIEWLN